MNVVIPINLDKKQLVISFFQDVFDAEINYSRMEMVIDSVSFKFINSVKDFQASLFFHFNSEEELSNSLQRVKFFYYKNKLEFSDSIDDDQRVIFCDPALNKLIFSVIR